jgi:hypothetical protein
MLRLFPQAEWVILNFSSTDNLHEYMLEKIRDAPSSLIYARLKFFNTWHASIAKNVAHRLGSKPCLFNLDCDNKIGEAIPLIEKYWNFGCRAMHNWSGVNGDGTFGRIALCKELFYSLGGYDEAFFPMGYQDWDLLRRITASGVPLMQISCPPNSAILNSKKQSMALCGQGNQSWSDMNKRNRQKSINNIAKKKLVANFELGWGMLNVEIMSGYKSSTHL